MFLVEWSYGLGSPTRSRLVETQAEVSFWSAIARSGGASMIVISEPSNLGLYPSNTDGDMEYVAQ